MVALPPSPPHLPPLLTYSLHTASHYVFRACWDMSLSAPILGAWFICFHSKEKVTVPLRSDSTPLTSIVQLVESDPATLTKLWCFLGRLSSCIIDEKFLWFKMKVCVWLALVMMMMMIWYSDCPWRCPPGR